MTWFHSFGSAPAYPTQWILSHSSKESISYSCSLERAHLDRPEKVATENFCLCLVHTAINKIQSAFWLLSSTMYTESIFYWVDCHLFTKIFLKVFETYFWIDRRKINNSFHVLLKKQINIKYIWIWTYFSERMTPFSCSGWSKNVYA